MKSRLERQIRAAEKQAQQSLGRRDFDGFRMWLAVKSAFERAGTKGHEAKRSGK